MRRFNRQVMRFLCRTRQGDAEPQWRGAVHDDRAGIGDRGGVPHGVAPEAVDQHAPDILQIHGRMGAGRASDAPCGHSGSLDRGQAFDHQDPERRDDRVCRQARRTPNICHATQPPGTLQCNACRPFVPGAPFFASLPQANTLRLSLVIVPGEKIDAGTRCSARCCARCWASCQGSAPNHVDLSAGCVDRNTD